MKTILIVEDSSDASFLIKSALEMEDYKVAVAGNGNEAILELNNKPLPDLILLDLSLPGMSGVQLLQIIRNTPCWNKAKVIFVSGRDNLSLKAEEAGADGFIRKPFGLNRLYSEVARYLH